MSETAWIHDLDNITSTLISDGTLYSLREENFSSGRFLDQVTFLVNAYHKGASTEAVYLAVKGALDYWSMEDQHVALCFQMFSRNNDINGNPYRLILVYSKSGVPVEAYQSRSSTPNLLPVLRGRDLTALPTFHLTAQEYKGAVKHLRIELQQVA